MGWQFRKSFGFGPLRINLSKRGVGASVGAGPFRIGRSASGRNYGSASIPGTGISYRTGSARGGRAMMECGTIGCAVLVLLVIAAAVAAAWMAVR